MNFSFKENYQYLILGLIIGLVVFLPIYFEGGITGTTVENPDELNLFNCKEESNWKICDVEYPDGTIEEEGYKKALF